MLELLGIASLSFMAALSGAVVPGPVFTLVVSESMRSGRIAGPLIVLGHLILELLIIYLVFLGLGPLMKTKHALTMMSFIGGAMLFFMGFRLMRDSLNLKINDVVLASNSNLAKTRWGSRGLLISGFLSSGSNPYFYLWWLMEGSPLIMSAVSIAGASGLLAFLFGHAFADLAWFSFKSYSIHKSRKFLSRRIVKAILFGSSIVLISLAIYLPFSLYFQVNMLVNAFIRFWTKRFYC
ncbi:LysE family transporter [Candidatus Bathyarchaeota archaeon]|nr:LysE family transporter [Candidatus Bathyarchaeota archaeon]